MNKYGVSISAIRQWFFIAVFIFITEAPAQEPPIMKAVRSKYNATTSLEARFDLHIFWKVREKEEANSGKIYFAPGDKFRVEAGKTAWVSNGETFWQSDKDDKGVQVVIKRLSEVSVSMLPTHILNTYVADYRYRLTQENATAAIVEWKADSLAMKTQASVIRLSIDKKSGTITSLFIIDDSGNESTYSFKKTQFPAKLSETLFEFVPPKGASIFDMRN
jgi:outer membrane lipoprotein-sorting protein